MRLLRNAVLSLLCVLALSARPAQAQVVTGLIGTLTGTGAGGYITLSIVVARAQMGHYLHDFQDLFDWKSLPVVIGAVTGTAVGVAAPDRMWTGTLYGAAGTVTGGTLGFLAGAALSDRPEAKWAFAAIGAGAGMALGSLLGMAQPNENLVNDVVPGFLRQNSGVPIGFTVRF